jgi:hypothetical protein
MITVEPGSKVLLSTVTYFWVGEIEKIDEIYIYLKDASWVGSTGRFAKALVDGELEEVEKVGDAIIARAAVVDVVDWKHGLPVPTSS